MFSEAEMLETERAIARAMNRAQQRMGEAVEPRTPATDAMLREELRAMDAAVTRTVEEFGEDPMHIYREFLRQMFDFFFEDGPHPGWAMRRIYLMARKYYPGLINNMNGTDLGLLFGVGRAAESHRLQLFNDRLRGAGVRGCRGGGAKREETRGTFAEAQMGNTNRTKKGPRKIHE